MTTYDPDLMSALICIRDAVKIVHEEHTGDLFARMDSATDARLSDDVLQALVAKGYLDLVDAGGELHMNVTSSGLYHASRFERQMKKGRVRA